jgi:hypothetical protein
LSVATPARRADGPRRAFTALSLLAAGLASAHDTARIDALPRLVGDRTRAECIDALALAGASFRGASFALDMPSTTPPSTLHSRFVVDDATFDDASPGGRQAIDPTFERVDVPAAPSREMLWERGAATPWRWVVTRDTSSWRGDRFGVFMVGGTTSQERFLAERAAHDEAKPPSDPSVTTLFEVSRQPYILRSDADRTLWVVEVGEPWRTFGGWKVFVRGERGPASPCSIDFGLPEDESASPLLPAELTRLDGLLLDALGPGSGEGALHPTMRIQVDVRRTWANVALRPWSLPRPYNTRDEVEAGLAQWASEDADQRAELTRIHALLPRAERSLAAYYRRVFGVSAEQARHCAAYAIDVALRMHFVFSSERAKTAERGPPDSNPWPAGIVQRRDAAVGPRR